MTDEEIDSVVGIAVDRIKNVVEKFVSENKPDEEKFNLVTQQRDSLSNQIEKLKADFEAVSKDKEISASEIARLKAEIDALKPNNTITPQPIAKPSFINRIKTGTQNFFNAPVQPNSKETRWDALRRRLGGPSKKLAASNTMNTSEWVEVYFNLMEGISFVELKTILKEHGIRSGRLLIESTSVDHLYFEIKAILKELANEMTSKIKTNFKKLKNNNPTQVKSFTELSKNLNKEELLQSNWLRSSMHVANVVSKFMPGLSEDRMEDGIKEILKTIVSNQMGTEFKLKKFNSAFASIQKEGGINGKKPIRSLISALISAMSSI